MLTVLAISSQCGSVHDSTTRFVAESTFGSFLNDSAVPNGARNSEGGNKERLGQPENDADDVAGETGNPRSHGQTCV